MEIIPELEQFKKGKDVLLTVKDTAGLAIYEACMQNNEETGIVLSKAANIIRRDVFAQEISNSNLLLPNTQEMSIPFSLLSLIGMIIGQVQIENTAYVESKVDTTLSQLIRFNMINNKRHKSETVSNIRHSKDQETPFPLYLCLLIHSKTRGKIIISKLAIHGLSVSYDRIQQVQLSVTKQLRKKYNDTGVLYAHQVWFMVFLQLLQ